MYVTVVMLFAIAIYEYIESQVIIFIDELSAGQPRFMDPNGAQGKQDPPEPCMEGHLHCGR